jgi:hypothetical protein
VLCRRRSHFAGPAITSAEKVEERMEFKARFFQVGGRGACADV